MNIYQKLIEVRKVVPYLQKGEQGTQYQYTGSSRVLTAVVDKLNELGLLLVPAITKPNVRESSIEFIDAKGNVNKRTTTYFTELEMTMTWINAEKPDETISVPWYGQGVDIAGEKGVGKALTYAEKYFMLKFFNIATDKDDPDAFQKKHDEPDEQRTQAPPRTQQQSRPTTETQSGSTDHDLASESQAKMLSVRAGIAKVSMDRITDHVGYTVTDTKEVRRSDVNKVLKMIDECKARLSA